jgi:hypothetical protein
MKNYRNAAAALMLAFVLSTVTYGDGIMHTDKATPTPTPAVKGIMHTDATQCITQTDAAESESGLAAAVTEVALSVLQSALTLF